MPAPRQTARRLRLLAVIDDLAAQWLEHRGDHQLLALARDPITSAAWQAAADAYPYPARGQIALAEALLRALHPPERSFTPGQLTAWREQITARIADLETLIDEGPENLVATLEWRQTIRGHLRDMTQVMVLVSRGSTLHGGQVAGELATRKYFMRVVTLSLRGMTGTSSPMLVAALTRAAFPGRPCDSTTVWRATDDLGNRGRRPCDAELSDREWLARTAEQLQASSGASHPPGAIGSSAPSEILTTGTETPVCQRFSGPQGVVGGPR
tara:strand:+ start:867 stop:1673 length:807 start_codon:yes stop_codon:yes gene_type:complete